MDLQLSQEQEMLRRSAREFLRERWPASKLKESDAYELGYDKDLWQEMAAMGWIGTVIPEQYGGLGQGFLDLGILVEELGLAAVPSPFISSIMFGAVPLLEAGTPRQKELYLPQLAKGELVLTMALLEEAAQYDLDLINAKAMQMKEGYVIHARKLFVPYADVADLMLCVVLAGSSEMSQPEHSIFLVPHGSRGISLTSLKTIANERYFEVLLEGTPGAEHLGPIGKAAPVVQRTLHCATAVQCAEMTGLAQKTLDMTVDYIKGRVQFGRPIGSFQAVRHKASDMLMDVEAMRWLSYSALAALDRGEDAHREVAIAKAWASDAYRRAAANAHQLHGGMGATLEYGLHPYLRRAKARELELGHARFHREKIIASLGL